MALFREIFSFPKGKLPPDGIDLSDLSSFEVICEAVVEWLCSEPLKSLILVISILKLLFFYVFSALSPLSVCKSMTSRILIFLSIAGVLISSSAVDLFPSSSNPFWLLIRQGLFRISLISGLSAGSTLRILWTSSISYTVKFLEKYIGFFIFSRT